MALPEVVKLREKTVREQANILAAKGVPDPLRRGVPQRLANIISE